MALSSLALLLAVALAQNRSGQVLDPVAFTAQSSSAAARLNDGSKDTDRQVRKAQADLARLNNLADQIERYSPDDPNTQKWRDYYERELNKFVADRGNDETALIRFRDVIRTSRDLLKEHQQYSTQASFQALQKALATAEKWDEYIASRWENWELRPRRPRDAIAGQIPSIDGSPVLTHQRLTESGVVGVKNARTVQYQFTNRDRSNRIYFWAKLSEADGDGNIVSNDDLKINPADWQKTSLEPGSTITLNWTVTPLSAREFSVGLQLEESSYMPVTR